jgi:hypothetical protein
MRTRGYAGADGAVKAREIVERRSGIAKRRNEADESSDSAKPGAPGFACIAGRCLYRQPGNHNRAYWWHPDGDAGHFEWAYPSHHAARIRSWRERHT